MFILCEGKLAEKPYKMPVTRQNIYSLEELCYYIYNNIYTITEEFFQESLAVWLREETDHPVLAKKVQNMLSADMKLKDMVVTILCGCDLYKESEIRSLVRVMDEIANLPLHKKKKIRADNYLRSGRYGRSLLEYRKLLQGSLAMNFSTEEYGDILHNQGIAHFYACSFAEAERDFKEAYTRNNKKISLRHYLWLLLMQEKEELFESEAISLGLSPDEINVVMLRYKEAVAQCHIPDAREDDTERYKKQLAGAYAC